MGILDWFKNRQSQFDPDNPSDELTLRAIEKAVTLTNPRLKLLRGYQERLGPAVATSVRYLREVVRAVPPAIDVAGARWASDPALRAFFASAQDIPAVFARSTNLRTLFAKYPELDEAYILLVMGYTQQHLPRVLLPGELPQRDIDLRVVGFSDHQTRICGAHSIEVRRLLGTQAYEYLLAQALAAIGDERSERRQLEDTQLLIRARLRLLQQQGPGLGSVFAAAPGSAQQQARLEAELLDNERQLEALGSPQEVLESELEALREVLGQPQRYLAVEQKTLRLNTLNVVVGADEGDVSGEVGFSLARLSGEPALERAFVLGRIARDEVPEAKLDFDAAQRFL